MNSEIKIVSINSENVSEYQPVCFLNPKNEGYLKKLEWLKENFSKGLIIKLLYLENEKKCNGFIEYIPGEYTYRAVDAKGYMFIHCIWISPNKYKEKGYGSLLVEECLRDARKEDRNGVAVVTSEGTFMAGRDLFLRNNFKSVAKAKPSYELMIKTIKNGPLPKFRDWEEQLSGYKGLNIVFSNQCPWVARSIKELSKIARKKGLELQVNELKNARQAQDAPSIYAVFNLIYNGKLLADHYISSRRFLNIIEKELNK